MKRFIKIVSVSATLIFCGYPALKTASAGGLDEDNAAVDAVPVLPGQQAIEQLLDNAADYVGRNEFDQAAAALERALRIEPTNSEIWHLLGQVRLHQGQYQQAEAMAEKSNSFAAADADLQERNAQIIAVARQMASGRQPAIPQTPVAKPQQRQHEPARHEPAQLADAESDDATAGRITIPITRYTLEEQALDESELEQDEPLLAEADDAPLSEFAEQTVLLIAQPGDEPDSETHYREPEVRVRVHWQDRQDVFAIDELRDRLRARADGIRDWIARAGDRPRHYDDDRWRSQRSYDEDFDNAWRPYREYNADFADDGRHHHRHRSEFRGKRHKKHHKHAGKHRRFREARAGRW